MRESSQALAAFALYRDLGPDRSLVAVAQKCGKHVSLLRRWSVAHRWVERVRAHDQAIAAADAERNRAARLAEMELRRAARLRIAAEIRKKIEEAVGKFTAEYLAAKPEAIARLAEYVDKTERLDYGEATQRVAVSEMPEFVAIRDRIIVALAPYPEAAKAVFDALSDD